MPDHMLTAPDYVWFVANLVIGLTYLHIPVELTFWKKGVTLRGVSGIIRLFLAFILGCGLHHLVMLRMVGAHPVDALQLFVDVSLAVISLAASVALYYNRSAMQSVFRALARLLE